MINYLNRMTWNNIQMWYLRCGQHSANVTCLHKKNIRVCQRWGAGVVICLQRGADLHMAQLMPLQLTVSCFSKIQIGFTFLVLAHLGSPGQRAVKRVCVCVCVYVSLCTSSAFSLMLLPLDNENNEPVILVSRCVNVPRKTW